MCMGYSNEIKAWVCEQTRMQSDDLREAWGQVWLLDGEAGPESASYLPHVPHVSQWRDRDVPENEQTGRVV